MKYLTEKVNLGKIFVNEWRKFVKDLGPKTVILTSLVLGLTLLNGYHNYAKSNEIEAKLNSPGIILSENERQEIIRERNEYRRRINPLYVHNHKF